MKTRSEILGQSYLNRTDIQRLLECSRSVANRIFAEADREDARLPFRAYPTKVRLKSVLKVAGLDYGMLQKQIKADARQSNPQTI